MARAYADDLRRKFLTAYEEGEGSLTALAGRFHVSVAWAKSVSAAYSRSGVKEKPPAGKRGRKSRITGEAMEYLRGQVKKQSDRTLVELQDDLLRDQQIAIGITRLWLVLKQLGLRLKKSRSGPPSRTTNESRRSDGSGKPKAAQSTRRNSSSLTKAESRRK